MTMQLTTKYPLPSFGLAVLLLGPACSDDASTSGTDATMSDSASETTESDSDTDSMSSGEEEMSASNSGDGDGDGDDDTAGDGDGDPAGDGDGDTAGDGDGDDSTTNGDGDGDDPTGDGDGDDPTGDGDGDMMEAVCGDGMVTGPEVCDDGVNDGAYGGCAEDCTALAPYCGDAEVNGPESCDDANADSNDGCLGSCEIPASCLEILEFDDQAASGPHMIAPLDPNATFEVDCDMETDGGGWTGLALSSMCNGDLTTVVTSQEVAPTEGIDDQCRPFTRDAAGSHAYQWDIEFPPGYDAFYLGDYVFKANALGPDTTDIWLTFAQTEWDVPYNGSPATGDVSFGSPDDTGPTTSYGAETMADIECAECETPFPGGNTTYAVGENSSVFRIAWGENGGQAEGFFPWWSGTVYLR